MRKLALKIKKIFSDTSGTSATEYGLIVTAVALSLILVYGVLTDSLNDGFNYVMDTIFSALGLGS